MKLIIFFHKRAPVARRRRRRRQRKNLEDRELPVIHRDKHQFLNRVFEIEKTDSFNNDLLKTDSSIENASPTDLQITTNSSSIPEVRQSSPHPSTKSNNFSRANTVHVTRISRSSLDHKQRASKSSERKILVKRLSRHSQTFT